MNILFLTYTYPPDLGAGSFRSEALIKSLMSKIGTDDKIYLITTYPNRYKDYFVETEDFEVGEKLIIKRIKLPNYFNGNFRMIINFIFYFISTIRIAFAKDISIVFATSSRLMTGVLGSLISRLLNAKYYLDIRDIFLLNINEMYSKKITFFLSPILYLLEKFMINKASTINLNSKGFSDYFKKKYPYKNYNFFTNGIDNIFLKRKTSYKLPDFNKKLEILYAGNIGYGQALSKIIPELAKELEKKVNFTIIGDGNDYRSLIKKINYYKNQNIKLLKPLKRDELIDYYNFTDIFFLHLDSMKSYQYVLPSKIFEYAVFDKPIFAGISGFSEKFLAKEIKSSYIFEPCNLKDAVKKFSQIEFFYDDRSNFIKQYSRKKISDDMSTEILNLHEKK